MTFVPLKKKSTILKLVELQGKWLVGKYLRKERGEFSPIYYLEEESGEIKKIYGSKSLDEYMDDSLIGEMIAITCLQIKDTGAGRPFAIAGVAIWDPNAPESLPQPHQLDPNIPTLIDEK